MTRPRIILDCDPGHDDAFAILMAGRHTEMVGITTVSGNVGLELTTRNALVTCQLLGLDVPVHAGADRPLVKPAEHAENIHGETGLDGPTLPPLNREVAGEDAAGFIIDSARRTDDLWLVAIGPLTNVALALRRDPGLADRLAGISIMGGSLTFGNTTAAAEFNIWADPEAADVVFRSGVRMKMVGLDLTHQFKMDAPRIERIRALGSAASTFAADLLTFFAGSYREVTGSVGGPLHDPCAVMALSHPELFESESLNLVVELRGEHTRGMTLPDRRGSHKSPPANVEAMTRIDDEAAFELLHATVADYR
jgi:inosine-uridine nucleoside N-ribohydrolase